MGDNAEMVRSYFEELNRIFAAGGEGIAELAERNIEPGAIARLGAMEGTLEDREGFIRYLEGQFAVIDDIRIDPLEIIEVDDDHVVMPFHLHGRARSTGLPIDFRYTQVFTMRDGRFARTRMFATKEKALASVGQEGELSIQERYLLTENCFGCGPHNPSGLHIRSFPSPDGSGVVSTWQPSPHHAANSGALNGGIVSTLLDCHQAAAVVQEMVSRDPEARDEWVTAELSVRFRRPAPPQLAVELFAEVTEWGDDRVKTAGELRADGKVCASATGLFARWVPRENNT